MALFINGRQVFTDKEIREINNSRVFFVDGSWCDTATNEIHNHGKGYITLDQPPQSGGLEEVTIGPLSFQAGKVEMIDLSTAKISVQPYDGTEIMVTITGPKRSAEAIKTSAADGVLVIEGPSGGVNTSGNISISGGNITMRGIRASSVVIGSNIRSSNINGTRVDLSGSGGEEVAVKLEVPKGTKISLTGDFVEAIIGDTEGDLFLSNSGVGTAHAGAVKSASLRLSGVGSILVDRVVGTLSVRVSGVGKVRVTDGKVTNLTVEVSGVGGASIGVTADEATLELSGMGNIYVKHVNNRPHRTNSGMGKIQVGNW